MAAIEYRDTGIQIEIAMVACYPDDRRITCADLDEFNDALIAWIEGRGMIMGGTLTLLDDHEDPAFARQVPDVKALVEAAERFTRYQPPLGIADGEDVHLHTNAWAIRKLVAALAALGADAHEKEEEGE